MPRRRPYPTMIALALAAAGGGCAAAPVHDDPTLDCQGVAVLVVVNSTSQTVEVMERHRRNEDVSHRVARLGPGTHEVTVRNEAGYLYRVVPVATSGADAQRQITSAGTIRYSRECRPADGRAP